MASLQIVPRATSERPSHLIRVAVPRLNKQDRIASYLTQLKARDYDLEWAEVIEARAFDCAGWNELMGNLLEDREWLAGKGGTGSWTAHDDSRGFFDLSESEQEEWKRGAFLYVVAAVAPTGQTIYIDPQGHDYARYVAFDASNLPEGKTRAQVRRDEIASEQAVKSAARAERIANPPTVPADHGLRFFWNGLKHNGGELFKCSYSAGQTINYPIGTVTVYAKDYKRFPASVAACFHVENESDSQSDHFDDDKLRVCPNHPLYALVLAAHDAQESHHARRFEKRADRA